MSIYLPGRGRKKAVNKFTTRDGLWMVLLIAAGMITLLILFLLRIFRFDAERIWLIAFAFLTSRVFELDPVP